MISMISIFKVNNNWYYEVSLFIFKAYIKTIFAIVRSNILCRQLDTCACIIISHNQLIMLHTAWLRIRRKEWYIINSWKYTLVILDYGSLGDWNCLATGFRLIDVVYFHIKRYTLEWYYNADFSRSLNAPVF